MYLFSNLLYLQLGNWWLFKNFPFLGFFSRGFPARGHFGIDPCDQHVQLTSDICCTQCGTSCNSVCVSTVL